MARIRIKAKQEAKLKRLRKLRLSGITIDGTDKPAPKKTLYRQASDIPINAEIAPIEVLDPHGENPGDTIIVTRSLRGDPLAAQYNHKGLTPIQYAAGRRLQYLYEKCQIGTVQAMDTSKVARQKFCGVPLDLNTDNRQSATEKVARIEKVLGPDRSRFVRDVLLPPCLTIKAACARRGITRDRSIRRASKAFAECLNTVAIELGIMTAPRAPEIRNKIAA